MGDLDSGQMSLESNKLELFRFLIKNGFEPIEKEKLQESPLSQFTEDQIKNFLDTYKTVPCESFLKLWIFKLVDLNRYKFDGMQRVFSQVIMKKAYSYPENNDYRKVYVLLAKILRGEIPDISDLGKRSTKILLLLIEDLRLKIHAIGQEKFQEILSEQPPPPADSDDTCQQILKTLMSMFKFKSIAEFMNPLNIPLNVNEKLMDQIRLDSPKE